MTRFQNRGREGAESSIRLKFKKTREKGKEKGFVGCGRQQCAARTRTLEERHLRRYRNSPFLIASRGSLPRCEGLMLLLLPMSEGR